MSTGNTRTPTSTTVAPQANASPDELPGILLHDDHDRTLLAHVRPPEWINPTPRGRYNLVVVGAGTAGLVAAAGAAGLGARVALIERRLMGGDCLNYGCVPSKALLRAARSAYDARSSAPLGVRLEGPVESDFAEVMRRMRRLRAEIAPHDSAQRFAALGVDVYLGDARFVSGDTVEVEGQRIRFSRAVIATGARPTVPPVPGLAQTGYLTNDTLFGLTDLPRRLVVIGAGPIGCEMAQAFRRFGSLVTIISLDPRLLPREDADSAQVLERRFADEGITMCLGATLLRVACTLSSELVVFTRGDGEEVVEADNILVAVGRTPNIEGLDLSAAGVTVGHTGVQVDDRLRTTNRRIYAAGDVCSAHKFTHAADAMARAVIQNALFSGRRKASALVMPWCTYTDPEIAHAGLYEREARARGYDVQTLQVGLDEVDRAVIDGETDGFARLHIDRRRGRILGATIVARHAGEMISEVTLAMTAGLPPSTLSATIHPYPTQVSVLQRLGDAYRRSSLTPRVLRILEHYFRWRR